MYRYTYIFLLHIYSMKLQLNIQLYLVLSILPLAKIHFRAKFPEHCGTRAWNSQMSTSYQAMCFEQERQLSPPVFLKHLPWLKFVPGP